MLPAIREQPPAAGSRDVAGAWVAAIYSHNERRARDFANTHAIIHAGADLPALLRRPELHCVYVASHPRHHAEAVLAALEADKHVLCEPPLALDYEEAAQLARMAEHRGLVLALNYAWRAVAAVNQVHELLATDAIGELLGGSLRNTAYLQPGQQTWRIQRNGGGVLWHRTLHDLDLLRFLLRANLREVYGHTGRSLYQAEVEDDLIGHVTLTGGLTVQLHDSFVLPYAPVQLELFGTQGAIQALNCGPAGAEQANLLVQRRSSVEQPPVPYVNPYRAAVARFVAAVRGLAPPLADAQDELQNLAALTAMRESADAGRTGGSPSKPVPAY